MENAFVNKINESQIIIHICISYFYLWMMKHALVTSIETHFSSQLTSSLISTCMCLIDCAANGTMSEKFMTYHLELIRGRNTDQSKTWLYTKPCFLFNRKIGQENMIYSLIAQIQSSSSHFLLATTNQWEKGRGLARP